jgi:pimeloyl-ACP methyl ester carboxylesterase/DNA-binding SARP family transcriptional activator
VLAVRVLGDLVVERDGAAVRVGSPKQRLLVAVLTAAGGPVSRGRLIDALWADDAPPSATNTLMGYVSRLRGALGSEAVLGHAGGSYSLSADLVDSREFECLVERGGVDSLQAALALWRGLAYEDFAGHPLLVAEVQRLHELRSQARVDLAAALFEGGDATRPVSMLESLVAESPSLENAWVLLIRALVAAGRYPDAVRAAHRCRRHLAEMGLEPSPELIEAEASALEQRVAVPVGGPEVEVGPIRYARNGPVHIAYQVVGGGPVDLVLSSYGSVSIDSVWDNDRYADFIRRLAASCRVVLYDTRGIGLSDPIDVERPPSVDEQADDLACVLAAAGAGRAVVVGVGDGGPVALTYGHRRSETLLGLVLVNTFARLLEAPDYRGVPPDRFEANLTMSVDPASDRDTSLVLRNHAPSVAGDAEFRRWWERAGRRGASPATATALWRTRYGADTRALLPDIAVPALVLHRRDTRVIPRRHGLFLAERIPRARYVELDGADQPPFTGDAATMADQILRFAVGSLGARTP